MRITLSLDDDVMEQVTQRAKSQGVSLGRMVSDLVRRGLSAPAQSQDWNGLIVFKLPNNSPSISTEDVRRLENGSRRGIRCAM
jgi:hypothetical protein